MTLPIVLFVLLALVAATTAVQPTCPNGQSPKLGGNGRPIQCLPGSSQKVVCGSDHACFFTGMNYVCCPSNEPTPENQPSCSNPYLTVLGADGMPLKCSPRTRSCPGKTQFCSDVGLAYICCEKAIGRDPPKEVDPSPRWEDSLECPRHSLGVLTDRGSRVVCNSKRRCPGRHQFCYGGLKRSICCERYDTAKSYLDDVANVKKNEKKKLKQISLHTFSTTSTSSPIIRSDTFVFDQKSKSDSVSVALKPNKRRGSQGARQVESLEGTATRSSSREFIKKMPNSSSIQKHNRVEQLNTSKRNRNQSFEAARPATRRTSTTSTTTTEEPTTTTEEILYEDTTEPTTRMSVTTERDLYPTLEPFRARARARVHAVKTAETQDKPIPPPRVPDDDLLPPSPAIKGTDFANSDFAPSAQLPSAPSEDMPLEDKREIAQTFLMQQIRDGWPYNDKFYRPGSE